MQAQLHVLPVPLRTVYLHQDDLFQQTNLLGEESNGREMAAGGKAAAPREAQTAKGLLFWLGIRDKASAGGSGRNSLAFIKYLTPLS